MYKRTHAEIRAEKLMYMHGDYYMTMLWKAGENNIIGKTVFVPADDNVDMKSYVKANYPGWEYGCRVKKVTDVDGCVKYALVSDSETLAVYDDPTVYTEG